MATTTTDLEVYANDIFHKCEAAFSENATNEERQQASVFLQTVGENDARFLLILERVFKATNKPEVIIFFSNLGLKTITKFWGSLDTDFLIKFRDFTIEYVKDMDMPVSVIKCVSRLPCRITKMGWLGSYQYRGLTQSIASIISENVHSCNKGLILLAVFIEEINNDDDGISNTKQRKISSIFRDKELLNIFGLSLQVLNKIVKNPKFAPCEANKSTFIENALDLTLKCLNYDFIGTVLDESVSEFGSLQIPTKWINYFKPNQLENDIHIINITWNILIAVLKSDIRDDSFKLNCVSKCLHLMNSLSLVRKSLFQDDDMKVKYYTLICEGTLMILEQYPSILNNLDVFNSFCRVLISIKNNCQINTIIKFPCYQVWIDQVAIFTTKSFELHSVASIGIHFLLQLWSKFSTSISYFRGKSPPFLDKFIPKINIEFLNSNLNHLIRRINDGSDLDSILNEVELSSINEFLPQLFLFDYQHSVNWVNSKFTDHIQKLKSIVSGVIRPTAENNRQLQVVEVELSWLIYVIASVISGNLPIGPKKESFKNLDADLCAFVFQIIPYSSFRTELQVRTGLEATPLLERAILCFFHNFQKSYIQMYISRPITSINKFDIPFFSIIGKAMNEKVDQKFLMDMILKKLLENLLFWYQNKTIVNSSLEMLLSISQGYESFKLAKESEILFKVVQNRFKEFTKFLTFPPNQKFRTEFFIFFTRFVYADLEKNSIDQFFSIFDEEFAFILAQPDYNSSQVVQKTIGICRDLTGVVRSSYKKSIFGEFFDWFHNKHFNTYLMLFEVLSQNSDAAVAMLKFLEEFVYNRSSRIAFDFSSVNGLNLFKSTHKALSTYGSRLTALDISNVSADNDIYKIKIKGIILTTSILSRLLCGNYIPFGAFEFYGDTSLKELTTSVVGLIFTLPLNTIYSYKKLAQHYYELMEILLTHHMNLIANLRDEIFLTILNSLLDGVQSTNSSQSVKAATSIDSICLFLINYRKRNSDNKIYQIIEKRISNRSEQLMKLASILFQLILFDNVINQFTLTRTLTSLLVFNPRFLHYYAKVLTEAQPSEQQQAMRQHFEELIKVTDQAKITNSIRDSFSRALISLKIHIVNVTAVPIF